LGRFKVKTGALLYNVYAARVFKSPCTAWHVAVLKKVEVKKNTLA